MPVLAESVNSNPNILLVPCDFSLLISDRSNRDFRSSARHGRTKYLQMLYVQETLTYSET